MKKNVALSLIILLFILTACAVTNENLSGDSPIPTTTSNPTETEPLTQMPSEEQTAEPVDTEAITEEPTPVILFENDAFSVSRVNGQYYMNFAKGNQLGEGEINPGLGEIKFGSLEEMKKAFLEGTLLECDYDILRSAFSYSEDDNGIPIWNFDELYQAVYPENVSQTAVSLSPTTLQFYNTEGCLVLLKEGIYQESYESFFQSYQDQHITISRQENSTFEGVPCEIVEYNYYNNSDFTLRDIWLDVSENNKELYIKYTYNISGSPEQEISSENTPNWITVYGHELGQDFRVHLYSLDRFPTVEWLSSFGITPYVDNSDHVAS